MIRPLLGALVLLAVAAPAASASDAEIFATNNTAVITDPGDPRLKDDLKDFARQVERIIAGGDVKRAATRYGKREFVEGPLPVRVERGMLVIAGTPDDDAIALTRRPGRIEVSLGEETFAFAARQVDRIRVDGGDGTDTAATTSSAPPRPRSTSRSRVGAATTC